MRISRGTGRPRNIPAGALSPQEMASRFPGSVRENVRTPWRFDDVPMLNTTAPTVSAEQVRSVGSGRIRFTGAVHLGGGHHDRDASFLLRVGGENARSAVAVRLGVVAARHYEQLLGLTLDVEANLDKSNNKVRGYRVGELVAVHGIECPIANNESSGVVRGIVRRIETFDFGEGGLQEPHKLMARGVDDAPLEVTWDPSDTERIVNAGLVELNSVVSMRVTRSSDSPDSFYGDGTALGAYQLLEGSNGQPPQPTPRQARF